MARTLFTGMIILLMMGVYGGGVMNHGMLEAGQKIHLPRPSEEGKISVEEALSQRRSTRSFSDQSLTLDQISQVLWAAQGITDHARGFRTAPSAGATFPLEVFLVAGMVDGLDPGVYNYSPRGHSLSLVKEGDQRRSIYTQALHQSAIVSAPAAVVIAGVFGRTTGRYGSRGERYVFMEVGHAGQSIHLQAQALGLGTVVIGAFSDSGVQNALDLPREVVPMYIMPLGVQR